MPFKATIPPRSHVQAMSKGTGRGMRARLLYLEGCNLEEIALFQGRARWDVARQLRRPCVYLEYSHLFRGGKPDGR